MPGIFISYRRSDAAAHAGRLHDRLAARFGAQAVFMDIDTLQPGEDFAAAIAQSIGSAQVVVVLIGRNWLDARDAQGRRRLEDAQDVVRLEVASALQRGVATIPVLLAGAAMPAAAALPEPLQPLASRHAIDIGEKHFHRDAEDLIRAIERHCDVVPAHGAGRRALLGSGAALAGVAVLGGAAVWWRQSGDDVGRIASGPPWRVPAVDPAAGFADLAEPAERRRISHILVAVAPAATTADRARAQARAENLAQKLRREPGQFAMLAQRFSDDASSAARGGDLGYTGPAKLVRPLDSVVFAMARKGEVVGPVETEFGFHVVELTGVQRNTRVTMGGVPVYAEVP
jgi:parvulin-like peptidyl-prolyl isomerase